MKAPTALEFLADPLAYACQSPRCEGQPTLTLGEAKPPHGRKLICTQCGWFIWTKLEKNVGKREKIGTAQRDAVWERFGNRCAVCNKPKEFLDALGIVREFHHVPPVWEAGEHDGGIPLCAVCHADATQRARETRKLTEWLAGQLDLQRPRCTDPAESRALSLGGRRLKFVFSVNRLQRAIGWAPERADDKPLDEAE